jgi:hypothetical protein
VELKRQIEGSLPKGHIYKLGNPSAILQSAGIPNLPIELSSDRLLYKANKEGGHPFELSAIQNLPSAMNQPIAIFASTKQDKSNVILTELQHSNNNFIVILRIRKDSKKINVEVNDIRSIYPKDNVSGILDWINSKDKLLKWVDKEKALNFFSTQSTNLIGGRNKIQDFNSATKVVKNFINPKIIPIKIIIKGLKKGGLELE